MVSANLFLNCSTRRREKLLLLLGFQDKQGRILDHSCQVTLRLYIKVRKSAILLDMQVKAR